MASSAGASPEAVGEGGWPERGHQGTNHGWWSYRGLAMATGCWEPAPALFGGQSPTSPRLPSGPEPPAEREELEIRLLGCCSWLDARSPTPGSGILPHSPSVMLSCWGLRRGAVGAGPSSSRRPPRKAKQD